MNNLRPLIDYMVRPGQLKLVESTEPVAKGSGKKRGRAMEGPFGFTNKPTDNGRTYIDELWENVIANPELAYLMENRLLLGEADHPPGEDLESSVVRTSHFQTALWLDKDKHTLFGRLEVVPTPCGDIINILVEHGWSPGVSSRGGGEEIRRGGDMIINPNNFLYYCHDIVVDPSCGKWARITEGRTALGRVRKMVESRYETYVSNAGDYDYFDRLLGKFGVRMEAIRESAGDKKKKYFQGVALKEEASPDVLMKRISELTEELIEARSGQQSSGLVQSHRVLLEKYDRTLNELRVLKEERRRETKELNSKLRDKSRALKEARIMLESTRRKKEQEHKLGGTTSRDVGTLVSEGSEELEGPSHTMRMVESTRRSQPVDVDDFSELSSSEEESELTSMKESVASGTARMVTILKKRGYGDK